MNDDEAYQIEYRDDGPVVTIDLGADWQAVYRMAPQASETVVAEIRIVPRGEVPPGGMTARLLRELRPGLAVRLLRRAIVRHRLETPVDVLAAPQVVAALAHDPRWRVYRPGFRRLRPWADVQDHLVALPTGRGNRLLRLAQTAALYIAANDQGDPAPNEAVARAQGRPVRAVRDDLHAARGAGLLSAAPKRGRAGGHLTDTARALLEGAA